MATKQISVHIDEDVYSDYRKLVIDKSKLKKTSVSNEVEEFMRNEVKHGS